MPTERQTPPTAHGPLRLETLVDFPDDALRAEFPLTHRHIDAMMAALADAGVQRVSWATYADGHGGYRLPTQLGDRKHAATYNNWQDYARTLEILGNPLRVGVEAAHRHGLEAYGYFKPYETGPSLYFPEGSPEAKACGLLPYGGGRLGWLDPFVIQHPDLRIQRRREDISQAPVTAIKLIKQDDAPTRLTKEHLQIWTSSENYRYRQRAIEFTVTESFETATKDVRDLNDAVVTLRGQRRRVLTLTGFELRDPYILVTTDFQDGPADFGNIYTEMLRALDVDGREIKGVFANGTAIWLSDRVDFRNWGLVFDHGWGCSPMKLDEPNPTGKQGFIAYARGRNEYLSGALCETEPRVQEYWLSWVKEMLDDGVDGIDFRIENHSTMTEFTDEYGFNQVILERSSQSGKTVAAVRGDAYTEFLRQAKQMIAARGKRMRILLHLDFFRPDPPNNRLLAFPANMNFDWPRWVAERIPDEVTLFFYTKPFEVIFSDAITQDMIARCRQRNIPVTVNRYISYSEADQAKHVAELQRVRRDGRFDGFVLYEANAFMKPTEDGGYSIASPVVELCRVAREKRGTP